MEIKTQLLSRELEEASTRLARITEMVPSRINMIERELSLCEKEILDIHHRIEMGSFNASQGWGLSKDIQITLRKRRALKDELVTLKGVADRISEKDLLLNYTKKIPQSIESRKKFQEARTYSLRVRKDFANNANLVDRDAIK